jgi:hypothetical protein
MYGAIPVRQPVSCFAAIWLMILTGAASPVLAQSFVSGLVYEKQGDGFRPIPHAGIHARSGATGSVVGQVEADAFGHYVLADLPEGDVVLSVSHPRYYPVRGIEEQSGRRVRCPAAGSCGEFDFEVIPRGELEVTVTDLNGEPINDVRVSVHAPTEPDTALGRGLKQRAVHGVFRTSAMRPGRYRVRAKPTKLRRDGAYDPVGEEVEFTYGQTTGSVRLVMPYTRVYRVSGTVEGLLNWDALHLLVVLRTESEGQGEGEAKRLGATLDKDGAFALSGVPRGAYSVNLVPVEGTALDARGPEVLLGSIRVNDDVSGLAFALPDL